MAVEEKVVRTLNLKKADGNFTSYPLGSKGDYVVLNEGISVEDKLAKMDLWDGESVEGHLKPVDDTTVVQGGGEPSEDKDLVTLGYLKDHIFKLINKDEVFSYINTAYDSSKRPGTLFLLSEFFEVDAESPEKLIINNKKE